MGLLGRFSEVRKWLELLLPERWLPSVAKLPCVWALLGPFAKLAEVRELNADIPQRFTCQSKWLRILDKGQDQDT